MELSFKEMADAMFITHFMFLLTFKLCSGERQKLLGNDSSLDNYELPESQEPIDNRLDDSSVPQRRFRCHSCEEPDCSNPDYCDDAIMCWKSKVRQPDGTETVSRGCIQLVEHRQFQCSKQLPRNVKSGTNRKRDASGSSGVQYYVECCQADLCNGGPFPILDYTTEGENYAVKLTLAILGSVIGLGIAIGIVLFCILARKKRRKRSTVSTKNKLIIDSEIKPPMLHFPFPLPSFTTAHHPHELRATAAGDRTLKEYLNGPRLTSGSGSGLPRIVQKTLAGQVALVECLGGGGNGGFGGKVWRGVWHGENVAVKIYFSQDEAAWARETEVYSQLLPSRHGSILGYVGSDATSKASCIQLWLVTHYHPLGSLFDYLNRSSDPLTHHQTLNICLSIANGLLDLHTEIHGTRGKPAMAHRNLKSKNIFVKINGSCVIADFALAITQDRLTSERVDLKQGAIRYMSPEILEQTLNIEYLESFRRADIYSLGLIFWEVCRMCVSNDVALKYAAPYSEWLPSGNREPSIEDMRRLVSLDLRRPPLPDRWDSDPTLAGMGELMRECWHGKPAARLPILRVKKTLVRLAATDHRVYLPLD